MKKLLFLIILVSPVIQAREYPLNPDRFPSIGLNVSASQLDGERVNQDLPDQPLMRTQNDSGNLNSNTFGVDLRLPINNGVTLNLSYDRLSYSSNLTRDGNMFRTHDSFNGNRFGFGVRVYLNK